MKTPRYTDMDRYRHGYRTAAATEIARTFERVRREQREQAALERSKISPLRKGIK